MNFKNIIVLMFLCGSVNAIAGTGMGNGANWAQSNLVGNLAELVNPNDGVRTFNGSGVGALIDQILPYGHDQEVESIFFDYLKKSNPEQALALSAARRSLTFYTVDQIKTVETGLQVPQGFLQDSLAYQEFKSHRVYLRKKIRASEAYLYPETLTKHIGGIDSIGSLGLASLRIHESYIRLGFDENMTRIDAETRARQTIAQIVSSPDFLREVVHQLGINYGAISQWLYAPEYSSDVQVILKSFLNFTSALSIVCVPTNSEQAIFVNDYLHSTIVKTKLFHNLCGYSEENGPEVTRGFDTNYNWANTSLISMPNHQPLPFPTLHYPSNHQLYYKVQTIDERCEVGTVEGTVSVPGIYFDKAAAKFQGLLNQWIALPTPIGTDAAKIDKLSISMSAKVNCSLDALAITYLSTDPNSTADETTLNFFMFASTPVPKSGSQADYSYINSIMSFDRFEVVH